MKKKKKTKWGLVAGFILVIVLVSTVGVRKMTEQTQHEKQLAFLKEHEKEMTKYIKTQNSKIEIVEYDWDSVKIETIGNGTPMGAGELMTIEGKFNKIKDSNFILSFGIDDEKLPELDTMGLLSSLYIGGTIYE